MDTRNDMTSDTNPEETGFGVLGALADSLYDAEADADEALMAFLD